MKTPGSLRPNLRSSMIPNLKKKKEKKQNL
jgi:hypothetical protein